MKKTDVPKKGLVTRAGKTFTNIMQGNFSKEEQKPQLQTERADHILGNTDKRMLNATNMTLTEDIPPAFK